MRVGMAGRMASACVHSVRHATAATGRLTAIALGNSARHLNDRGPCNTDLRVTTMAWCILKTQSNVHVKARTQAGAGAEQGGAGCVSAGSVATAPPTLRPSRRHHTSAARRDTSEPHHTTHAGAAQAVLRCLRCTNGTRRVGARRAHVGRWTTPAWAPHDSPRPGTIRTPSPPPHARALLPPARRAPPPPPAAPPVTVSSAPSCRQLQTACECLRPKSRE